MKTNNLFLKELQKTGIGMLTGTFRSEQPILGMLGDIEMHNRNGWFNVRLFANSICLGQYTLRQTKYLNGNSDNEKFEGFISFEKSLDEQVEYGDADVHIVGWYETVTRSITCESVGYFIAVQKRTTEELTHRYTW